MDATPDPRRRVRQVALWLGAVQFPLTILWSVVGAGMFGSPLGDVRREGWPIVLAILVLGGPLGLLPLALLSRRWPRLAGGILLAGGRFASLLAGHPWGLGYAAPGLYSDAGQVFAAIAFVPMAFGAALLVLGRGWRGWTEVLVLAAASTVATFATTATIERREAYAPFRTLHPISFLAFAPDGRTLFVGGMSSGVRASPASLSRVDADTGQVQVLGESMSAWVMAPDRETLVTVGRHEWADETVFWNTRTLRVTQKQPHAIGPIALSTTGYAAVPLRGGLQVVPLGRGRHPPLLAYEGETRWVAWLPDGGTLAIGRWKRDDVLLVPPPFSEPRTLRVAGGDALEDGQYSPDGRLLAVATGAGPAARLRLYGTSDGRELPPLAEHPVSGAPWFAPGGAALLTLRVDETARPARIWLSLWDTSTWRRIASFPGTPTYAWSPDGSVLATFEPTDTGRGSRLVARRVADGVGLGDLGTVDFMPAAVAFSPDGTRVAVGGDGPFLAGYARGDVALVASPRGNSD